MRRTASRTKLRKGDELATCFSGLVDPVDCLLDRQLEVKPAGLGIDGRGLVLADCGNHVDVSVGCCFVVLLRW